MKPTDDQRGDHYDGEAHDAAGQAERLSPALPPLDETTLRRGHVLWWLTVEDAGGPMGSAAPMGDPEARYDLTVGIYETQALPRVGDTISLMMTAAHLPITLIVTRVTHAITYARRFSPEVDMVTVEARPESAKDYRRLVAWWPTFQRGEVDVTGWHVKAMDRDTQRGW